MAQPEPEWVMGLLETGREPEARAALADRFAGGAPVAGEIEPETAFLYALHQVLTTRVAASGDRARRAPSRERADRSPNGRYTADELVSAADALDHAMSAADALRTGRVDDIVSGASAALERAPASMPWLSLHVGSLYQASYRFTARADLRVRALDVLGSIADRIERPHLAIAARALMGNIHMMQGALHRARSMCDAALDLADATDLAEREAPAMAWQFKGYVLFEWNRLDEAEAALLRAWELGGHRAGVGSGVARVMGEVRLARGDGAGAAVWLRRLTSIVAEPLTLRNREWLAAARAGQTLGAGGLRAVERWLASHDYRPENLLDARHVLARLQELDQVLTLLEATSQWGRILQMAPRVTAASRGERQWFATRALVSEAVALEAEGRSVDADTTFLKALNEGREGSFVRAYVAGSPIRGRLLERALEGRDSADDAHRIVGSATDLLSRPESPSLTPTQREILDRVAEGDSNKTIARAMGVSTSTVKTHLRAIFKRLNVASRTQAVARARRSGLLGG